MQIQMKLILFVISFTLIRCQENCGNRNLFLCGSGECISKEYLCDGTKECADGSDETDNQCKFRSCSLSFDYIERESDDIFDIPSLSTTLGFRCNYGACISNHFVCDGLKHCVVDGSDETRELCHTNKCKRNEFRCDYGACISRRSACDNRNHCADQSDETKKACEWRKRKCFRGSFMCTFGACIRGKKKCDGIIDCLDSSDESEATCGPRPGLLLNSSIPIEANSNQRFQTTTSRPIPTPFRLPSPKIPTESPLNTPKTRFLPTTTPKPISKNECVGVADKNIKSEIFTCGSDGKCDGLNFPKGTVMVVHCNEGSIPLRCSNGLWHNLRAPNEEPRMSPCLKSRPIEGPDNSAQLVISPKPKVCGDLPMFQPLPWLVGLFRDREFACTGTVIGPSLILTAAHCVVRNQATKEPLMSPDSIRVQFYSVPALSSSDFAKVSTIKIHPGFSGGQHLTSDVALLFLEENLESSRTLSSACLDTEGKLLGIPAWTFNRTVGQTFYSWNYFQQTLNRECFNKATRCSRHLNIGDNQFCAINSESPLHLHQGSSGGPYFIVRDIDGKQKWTVAGIVSNTIHTSDCGTPHTVFSSASKFHSWITRCGFEGDCTP